jgi:hypothetical protein
MYSISCIFYIPSIYRLLLAWDRLLKQTLSSGKGTRFRPVEKYSCLLALHFLLRKAMGREDTIGMYIPTPSMTPEMELMPQRKL